MAGVRRKLALAMERLCDGPSNRRGIAEDEDEDEDEVEVEGNDASWSRQETEEGYDLYGATERESGQEDGNEV